MNIQNTEVFAARVERTAYVPCFTAHIEGGAADGLKLLLRAPPGEHRRWVYAARKNTLIQVVVEAKRVTAGLEDTGDAL
jgi:hypothetical protein